MAEKKKRSSLDNVLTHLENDEAVLWSYAPTTSLILLIIFCCVGALVLVSLCPALVTIAISSPLNIAAWLTAWEFIKQHILPASPVIFAVGTLVAIFSHRFGQIVYAITPQRMMIVNGSIVKSIYFREVEMVSLLPGKNGTGTLYFGPQFPEVGNLPDISTVHALVESQIQQQHRTSEYL